MLNIYRNATPESFAKRRSALENLREVAPAPARITRSISFQHVPETTEPGPDAQIVTFPSVGAVVLKKEVIIESSVTKEAVLRQPATIPNVIAALEALPGLSPTEIPTDHYNGHGHQR